MMFRPLAAGITSLQSAHRRRTYAFAKSQLQALRVDMRCDAVAFLLPPWHCMLQRSRALHHRAMC